MTWVIGLGPPGCVGITPPGAGCGRESKESFARTCCVNVPSAAAPGTEIDERDPRTLVIQYAVGSRFGPTPVPFMFVTKSLFDAASTAIASGYQAVGISPRTLGVPVREITATSLSPPFVT